MIFVFDLDGTICFKGEPLSNEICGALDFCSDRGHEIVFASARPIRDMLPVLPKKYHSYRMVGGNGAFTFQHGEVEVHSFSTQVMQKIVGIIEEYQLTYLVDSDWDYSYTGDTQHPIFRNLDPYKTAFNKPLNELKIISKAVVFTPDMLVKQKLQQLPITLYEHSHEELFDISPKGIHKMEGLKKLGIHPGEFTAFGNDQNDLPLFENAKYSVCVGNHAASKFASRVILQDEVSWTIKELAVGYL